ncbi:MAG: flagellar protein FliT [Hydrogenovibrio sp.]
MNSVLLNALHESKMLLNLAEKGDWDAFFVRHVTWFERVNQLLEQPPEASEASIQQLLDDVDAIKRLMLGRMEEIESSVSVSRKQKNAVKEYLR